MSETTSSQCIFLDHSLTSASNAGKNVAQITLCHYTSRDIIRNKFVLGKLVKHVVLGVGELMDPSELVKYIAEVHTENGKFWSCSLCNNLLHKVKMNVRNHVESVHFPGAFSHKCPECGKDLPSNDMFYQHMSKYHKK